MVAAKKVPSSSIVGGGIGGRGRSESRCLASFRLHCWWNFGRHRHRIHELLANVAPNHKWHPTMANDKQSFLRRSVCRFAFPRPIHNSLCAALSGGTRPLVGRKDEKG